MNLLKDLWDLWIPNRCLHCKCIINRNSFFLCTDCELKMEFTSFTNYANNPLEQLFLGHVKIQQASALFYYQKKSPIQTLLKLLKYNSYENIGHWAATGIINEIKSSDRFLHINMVIPVPLHPLKEKKRGYNQVDLFAKTIAKHLQAQYLKDGLIKVSNNKSQTQQNKDERYNSVKKMFKLNPNYQLNNCHILLVDDVLTTGATLISCAKALKTAKNVNISIITIACVV